MLSKYLVKKEAKRIRSGIEKLDPKKTSFEGLFHWKSALSSFINHVHGPNSDHLDRLSRIDIEFPAELDDRGEPYLIEDPWEKFGLAQRYLLGYIDNYLAALRVVGLPINYRAPRRNSIITHVLTFIGAFVIAHFTSMPAGQTESDNGEQSIDTAGQIEKEKERLFKAKELLTDFRGWIETNNLEFKDTLQWIVYDNIKRNVYGSGPFFQHVMKVSREWRMRRDNSLDSMLVWISSLGVDTDTLTFDRRLPVRIGKFLESCAPKMGDAAQRALRSEWLDTL